MLYIKTMKDYVFTDVDEDAVSRVWNSYCDSGATNIVKRRNSEAQGKRYNNTPYYSIMLNGKLMKGERPWDQRWELIKSNYNFSGKRVLEFGSNMGLWGIFAIMEGAASFIGVERDRVSVDVANGLAHEFGVNPTFINMKVGSHNGVINQVEYNDEDSKWQGRLGADYDVVMLLSVLKYMPHKDVMEYVSNFAEVIYEEKDGTMPMPDIQFFSSYGFTKHKMIGKSERDRPVYIFSK